MDTIHWIDIPPLWHQPSCLGNNPLSHDPESVASDDKNIHKVCHVEWVDQHKCREFLRYRCFHASPSSIVYVELGQGLGIFKYIPLHELLPVALIMW